MNGIFVKIMSGACIFQATEFLKSGALDIRADGDLVARYATDYLLGRIDKKCLRGRKNDGYDF